MIKNFDLEAFKKDCAEFELDADSLLEKMENWDSKQWALFEHVGESANYVEDINDLDIDDSEINFDGEELLILTDNEADYRADLDLDSLIEEVVYNEIPEIYQRFFDEEAYKNECLSYGRGQVISGYDGLENQHIIEYDDDSREFIYIYRV